jgi:hypothetical protein
MNEIVRNKSGILVSCPLVTSPSSPPVDKRTDRKPGWREAYLTKPPSAHFNPGLAKQLTASLHHSPSAPHTPPCILPRAGQSTKKVDKSLSRFRKNQSTRRLTHDPYNTYYGSTHASYAHILVGLCLSI